LKGRARIVLAALAVAALTAAAVIGATTRTGLITGPLRDRFGFVARLDYYTSDDLATILRRSATILDASEIGTDVVRVGSIVHVKEDGGKSTKYTIVGSAEANPADMKLSNESPVGKALLGHKRGEEVVFSTPKGERRLKITKIDVSSK